MGRVRPLDASSRAESGRTPRRLPDASSEDRRSNPESRDESLEVRIDARRRLSSKARFASRVREGDPYEWARGVRQEVPELVAAIGHAEFQHLVRYFWRVPPLTDFAVTRIPDLNWGSPRIARAVAKGGDPWGILSVLKETPWEELFPLIPSRIFDEALRGHATPMMKILGPPSEALAKRLPPEYKLCRMRKGCINASPTCEPGKKMPECWEAESVESTAVEVASKVARFWKEGVLVIIVVPEE